jgi:Glycosyltransferase family 87
MRRLSSRLPADLRGPLLGGVLLLVASWSFVWFLPAFGKWLYGDVRFYEGWGALVANHQVPYRDFRLEYPPGAVPVFVLPVYLRKLFGYHGTYYTWFRAEMLAIALLTLAATAWALARLRAPRRRAYAALGFVAVAPALLGPMTLARYDLWPTLFAVAGVAALLAGRPVLACALLGAGTVVKVFPIVLVPLALLELWRQGRVRAAARGLAAAVVVAAVSIVPFLAVAPHGLAWALHRQISRPLQVESLGAAVFVAAHQVAGLHLHVVKSAGSDNLVGPGTNAAGVVSGIATVLALLALYALYLRSERGGEQLVLACVAAVTAYVALAKVFSPQYLIWLMPLVPLVGGRAGVRATALLAAVLGLTQIWEPFRYGAYVHSFTPWLSWLVIVRDLLVVLLLGLLVRPLVSRRHAQQLDAVRLPAV